MLSNAHITAQIAKMKHKKPSSCFILSTRGLTSFYSVGRRVCPFMAEEGPREYLNNQQNLYSETAAWVWHLVVFISNMQKSGLFTNWCSHSVYVNTLWIKPSWNLLTSQTMIKQYKRQAKYVRHAGWANENCLFTSMWGSHTAVTSCAWGVRQEWRGPIFL